MHRAVRCLMALLLAVALPMQGVIAATMQTCSPSSAAADRSAPDHSHREARAPAAHSVQHHHDAQLEAASAAAEPQHHADHAAAGKSKCSVCAVCCAGAAPPSPSLSWGETRPGQSFGTPRRDPPAVFLNAGLERPPKAFLA